jgi:hypothetical protein
MATARLLFCCAEGDCRCRSQHCTEHPQIAISTDSECCHDKQEGFETMDNLCVLSGSIHGVPTYQNVARYLIKCTVATCR